MHLILHELKWSLLKFTVPKNKITIKTKFHLPREYVTLVDFGILFRSFEFSCSQILKKMWLLIFVRWANLMNAFPETRRAY